VHQLVNKDFDSIKLHGTAVKKKEKLFFEFIYDFPFAKPK